MRAVDQKPEYHLEWPNYTDPFSTVLVAAIILQCVLPLSLVNG